ncbi:MAG: molecular chaperone TorD family protein [Fimbriimonadaceae bacterium]|nr:molecular chaperone TorD family protein [Fimbriimonadaceae bacterium]
MRSSQVHPGTDWQEAATVMLRSCLLRGLAHAFAYPTAETYAKFRECLEAYSGGQDALEVPWRDQFAELLEIARSMGHQEYEAEYLQVFSHVCAADCNPCETAYTSKHIFQASQRLATITGLYRAFGLESWGERPDHIAVELEFLAFLRYREAMECEASNSENRELLRRGQTVFIERHLGRWVRVFAELARRKADTGVIGALAALLPEVVASEAESLGIALPELPSDLSLASLVEEVDMIRIPSPSGESGGVFSA